ncbi:MAG TPA: TonB-dependent receptor [Terracidiphilus sp.]|nr:TonB-dependent receptor [Terracidiphilus sp.]
MANRLHDRVQAHVKQLGRIVCLVAALVFLASGQLLAQFDSGTISGTVTDSTGASVAAASVTITNVGTGVVTTLKTNSNGFYSAAALPFGTYTVQVSAPGFSVAISKPLVLNVGANAAVNLKLAVASASESVEVSGTQTAVNTQTAAIGTTLNADQVQNLPINGRDVNNFLEISPGSVGSGGYFQGSVNGMENIFAGLTITVDGQSSTRADVNGFLNTEGQEAARVTRSSIDSIQEIDFSNAGYGAETGHSLGPQMNIITKGGTNQFHGTAFDFLRNNALDARDYFEDPNTDKVPLRLNQFGGNLSGPIVRQKLFFFVNYEGDRERITSTPSSFETLSAYARSQGNSVMQGVFSQLAPLPADCTAIPAPASCADPSSVGTNTPDEGANLVFVGTVGLPLILREDTGSARVDYQISPNDRIYGRYNINDSLTNYTYGINQDQVSPQKLRTQLGRFDYTHIFTPTLLSEFGIGINRFYSDTFSNTPQPFSSFAGFFTNLGSLPGPNTYNQINPYTTYELFENMTKVAGNHSLKFGAQIRVNRQALWLRPSKTYYYASFSDLFNNNPFVLAKIGFPNFVGTRNSNWDVYFQDNWKVSPRLTFNLGMRYEYNTVWSEQNGKQSNFDVATQSFTETGAPIYSAPRIDIAPRVGFAYDLTGDQKTVIHGYGGLFYLPMQFGLDAVYNIPEYSNYNVNVFDALFGGYSIAYPAADPPVTAGTQNVYSFQTNPRDPVALNWLFGVERQLPWDMVATINYTGNRVQHMQSGLNFAGLNANPANLVTSIRENYSGFANESIVANNMSSEYHALQVQLRRSQRNMHYELNYSYSHEIDNEVNVFSPGLVDPSSLAPERASGDIDVRHNLTGSLVYNLPRLEHANRLTRTALGDWQMASILQMRGGLPTNITLVSGFFGNPTRPLRVSSEDPYVKGGKWSTGKYNAAAFAIPPDYDGTPGKDYGSIGRNYLRGPAFYQLDFSLMKNFPITEKLRFQFRADLFNILNHPNLASPDGGICSSVTAASGSTPASCTPNTLFGESTATIQSVSGGQIGNGTARQAQFSAKIIF